MLEELTALLVVASLAQPHPSYRSVMNGELRECTELSQHIVLGTVLDTTCVYAYGIYTKHNIRVDRSIKGEDLTRVIEVGVQGGRIGRTIQRSSHQTIFNLGAQYLLFINSCDGAPFYQQRGCSMLVEEGLAHGRGHDLPFDALEDSLRLFLDATRIPVMKRLAHAVVEGRVATWDVPPPERKSPSLRRFSFKLAVAQVLHQRSGPRIPQDTLLVVSPAVRDGGGGIYGTKASIQVGEDYMLLLRWDGGEWLLDRTAYSTWRRRDGRAEVVAEWPSWFCPDRRIVVEGMDWSVLVELLKD